MVGKCSTFGSFYRIPKNIHIDHLCTQKLDLESQTRLILNLFYGLLHAASFDELQSM